MVKFSDKGSGWHKESKAHIEKRTEFFKELVADLKK